MGQSLFLHVLIITIPIIILYEFDTRQCMKSHCHCGLAELQSVSRNREIAKWDGQSTQDGRECD